MFKMTLVFALTFCFNLQAATPQSPQKTVTAKKTAAPIAHFAPKVNTNAPMQSNLRQFTGKKIGVTLKNGRTYKGTLKSVGLQLIHVAETKGKTADTFLAISEISSVTYRTR